MHKCICFEGEGVLLLIVSHVIVLYLYISSPSGDESNKRDNDGCVMCNGG